MAKGLGLALAVALASTGCAHVTRIESDPPGARIFVNGVPLGPAPLDWETRSGLPGEAYAKAELDGFAPTRDVRIKKAYRADASLLLLLPGLVPYLFTARFEDEVRIRLEPVGPETAPVATTSR